ELSPGHKQSLRLQAKLYERLEDWGMLRGLVPRLRQYQAYKKAEIDQIALLANKEILIDATAAEQLQAAWDSLDKTTKTQPKLIATYARGLLQHGQAKQAEAVVNQALKKHWDESLLDCYADLSGMDANKQLSQVENWLKKRGESAKLLQVAAKLCVRVKLWGKARSYIESSLAMQASPESYQLHGELLQHLGEVNEASESFKKGLQLLTGQTGNMTRILALPQNK
ncbi:MAG: hypothetical protein HKN88_09245, partial [Gammaproteobacteria bacterium]|nr:hypothetical protein [Gammaproteobacteria bacterium]